KLLTCRGKREAGPYAKRGDRRRAVSTVGPEPAAVAVKPGPRPIVIRRQALHQSPEARPVIHLREMRDLVRHNIIEDAFRRQNEPPAKRKTPGRRAAAPAARRVAHGNPGDLPADPLRQQARPARHLLARPTDQIVADPPAEMSGVASDPDPSVDPRDRPRLRVTLPPDAVRRTEHRHDRALNKRHGARQ